MADSPPRRRDERLDATRLALHAVAEQLLAGPQHRRIATVRLAVADGGFTTGQLPGEPSRLAVRGTTLIADHSDGQRCVPLSGSIAELARAVGVEPGAPADVYHDGSGTDPSFEVSLDAASAAEVLLGFQLGDQALREVAARHAAGAPEAPVLWPEHFDVAITLNRINLGVSPGDGYIDEPYAYVGPWEHHIGAFWDQPFGAARLVRHLQSAEALLAFFEEGLAAAVADPTA